MPSFYTNRSDFDPERIVTKWLRSTFIKKCRPGIIFLHPLDSDLPHDNMPMLWHLETMAEAFLRKFTVLSCAYVVPTSERASTLPSETLSQRLLQLETTIGKLNGYGSHEWHASMFPGVFKGQPETAWSAALLLLKSINEAQAKKSFASPSPALRRTTLVSSDAGLVLKDLADLLFNEFKKKRRNDDLDAKITLGRISMECTPPEQPQRHSTLIDLADLLSERFKMETRKEDLDELITLKRAASEHMPPNDPQRQVILRDLWDMLSERFKKEGRREDLDELITLKRAASEQIPPSDPQRQAILRDLEDVLYERFKNEGRREDLDELITLKRVASEHMPPNDLQRQAILRNLEDMLSERFKKEGRREDLDELIMLKRAA
ncbi:hypothetical protein BKA82DRAFT_741379, partial [Pisolithus tinctorius]